MPRQPKFGDDMMTDDEDEVEIDITDDDETLDVVIDEATGDFGDNLADSIADDVLLDIGTERLEVLQNLKNGREEWETRIKQGIRWLGITSDEQTNEALEDACTAVHPLLMENVVKFQAKAIQELWPAAGPVKTKIRGYIDEARELQAGRVRNYMNYQLMEQIDGVYADLERNLFRVGFMGTGLRKVQWNPDTNAPDPAIVYVENFYVDPAVTHLKHADEHIELMELSPRKMENLVAAGQFRQYDDDQYDERIQSNEITQALNEAQGFSVQVENKGMLLGESHCFIDLEGDDPLLPEGGRAPYVVHFNATTGRVYAIRRNWTESDPKRQKRLCYTADIFIPAFGFYGLGFVHLIGDLAAGSTVALRALVDAGQLSNMPSGYKSQDAKIANSDISIKFGEFRDVALAPEELAKAFFPLPVKEPSRVLFELLQYMVAAGQKFADTTDQVVAQSTNYGPAATTLALLEASQRFYSSIHKRLHQSQHEFFRLIGRLNYENLPDHVNFVLDARNAMVGREDFNPEIVDIIPASDPNALSESQRVAKAQIELDIAARFPQMHDLREALRRFYVSMGTENVQKLLPDPETSALTADPLSELQAAMKGRPIKAQMGQNHLAHIAVKEAFLQSPQMQGTNDPTVAVGMELLKSNIAEHKTLLFVAQVMQQAQQMGVPAQSEEVQAQIAQQMVAMSAAQNGGPPGPSVEERMLELNAQELQIAKMRIDSQDARESAKIAQKNVELELKKLQLMRDAGMGEAKLKSANAGKLLDIATKLAQIEQKALAEQSKNSGDA